MSQAGELSVQAGVLPVDVPTTFSTNGTPAVPAANELEIIGSGTITTSGAGNTITISQSGAGAALQTLTPNSGGAVSPVANNINDQGLSANAGANAFPLFSYNGGAGQLNWENRTYLTPYIVDHSTTNGRKGTFTTIAAAYAQAVTDGFQGAIGIRPGTYTENVTLSPGIDITALSGNAEDPDIIIAGTLTLASAGTVTVSNIELQTNASNLIVVSAGVINFISCNLKMTNNTGISATGSGAVNLYECIGDVGTTGIAIIVSTSTNNHSFNYCIFTNSGSSVTPSTTSGSQITLAWSYFNTPFTANASSNASIQAHDCTFDTYIYNVTCVTLNGTTFNETFENCSFNSGTASAISIGSGVLMTLTASYISCTNTNAITGLGTVYYSQLTFNDDRNVFSTSKSINTTAQIAIQEAPILWTQGFARNYKSVSSNYQMLYTDSIIGCSTNAGAITVTLPTVTTTVGQMWTIKDELLTAATHNITLSGGGIAFIYGTTSAGTYVISTNGGSANLYWNGTNFYVV